MMGANAAAADHGYVTLIWPVLSLVTGAAIAISAALIVVLRPLLTRYALARPNARSSHREPTPQGGGIAVCAATIGVAAATLVVLPQFAADGIAATFCVLAATTLVAMIGAVDDIRALAVGPRLLMQVLAVVLVVAALPPDMRIVPGVSWWIERVLIAFAGVWFINLVNFMDGIDWMTVAEMVPITAGLGLVGLFGGLPPTGIVVALALLGAIIGFAPFNRPVARLFLGDVGSLPIGLLTGWLLMRVAGSGHLAAALLLPLYYLADATITLARRLANGEAVWQAHRSHFYQRATDNGLTVPQVVGRVFCVNLALVGLALVTVAIPSTAASLTALAIGAALVTWLLSEFVRARQ